MLLQVSPTRQPAPVAPGRALSSWPMAPDQGWHQGRGTTDVIGGPRITDRDRERSATASGMEALHTALAPLQDVPIRRMLDIGCGYGGLAASVAARLGVDEVHGVDIDASVIEEAERKNLLVQHLDVESEPLPFEDGSIDLVISLGMLDYLPTFDFVLSEIRRVLSPDGHALISLPNLGSWHNRLALLLGYQPRDVEISEQRLVGTLGHYRGDPPSGHVHTATLRAFRELMSHHGFDEVNVTAGSFTTRRTAKSLVALDRLVGSRPALARRFFYLGKRGEAAGSVSVGWWRGRRSVRTRGG